MLFRFFIFFLPALFSLFLQAQNQSDVRKKHIRAAEVTSIDYKKNNRVIRTFTRYNRKGNVVELIEYGKNGTDIENRTCYQYNRKGKITAETQLSEKGDTLQTIITRYNRFRHPVETVTMNALGQVTEKQIPFYDSFHRKTKELTLSGSGDVLKQVIYEYDKRGMLIVRRTYDANGNLQYEKTWHYTY